MIVRFPLVFSSLLAQKTKGFRPSLKGRKPELTCYHLYSWQTRICHLIKSTSMDLCTI